MLCKCLQFKDEITLWLKNLQHSICSQLEQEDGKITVNRPSEAKQHKALHGLYRALINNMIVGVSTGWKRDLEMIGVGYRAKTTGQQLELALGYSHPIVFEIPSIIAPPSGEKSIFTEE
mgnify:CR=1 FL=1